MKCLLVDDDYLTLQALKDYIEWESLDIYEVVIALNIEVAKKIIQDITPEVVICDIEMPKGTGIDLIKWIRNNNYNLAFAFFTSYEKFEYASNAIAYDADAYLVKPFEKEEMEAALAKIIDSFKKRNRLNEYSQYGRYWIENKDVIEKGFWNDILDGGIPQSKEVIQEEVQKRDISICLEDQFYMMLLCLRRSQIDGDWENDSMIRHSLDSVTSELLSNYTKLSHVVSYIKDDTLCNVIIIKRNIDLNELKLRCLKFISTCNEAFQVTVTCYISRHVRIEQIAKTKKELEELDRKNIVLKGKVIIQSDYLESTKYDQYVLDERLYNQLFSECKKVDIVHTLKKELDMLVAQNKLDSNTMHSICQDFMQIVYSYLGKNGVQAHELFSNNSSQILYRKSQESIFDMMKWTTYITNTVIDYVRELRQSESVIEKAKQFIFNHYNQSINRENVASSVYLTPDYLSRIFKEETGLTINNFINKYRIDVAKELLVKGNATISHIATETGFDSLSYFSTVFKRIVGETPHSYRKMYTS